ncbi:two-component sensor histidine kinase,Alkaline phosphatase synthesis sensor protein phoR,signal transduction histidine-protein kinase BaeS,Predicted periplasmic ligand-binding sensor domain,phosphate regulon sensor kinase PhoR,His Kinase A (phospho-acceptor) domain [[Clostridium] sordellii]|uniref:HAMP domain-containing sensor histidine kinase n=1 Tax=Paraclostridium sordellii TaxID=1505 RepID=UPI0005442B1F|nr:sensor histidine kinase [Paeniclostridium sordellii]CEK34825.1 two-component sensor histidine kinase,Alkaline phosphatase synthesis sensor protein phoR,signal transduction histidine-protein kinase BaeS,Predicted periplasmic ligand-binding sensor domain,phosphate regulon sensor kinase PhoR,His Kinase A (phospho-acceptor) domain [[Clostridium] sordellii] [Paeniclostridium sordellii]
MDKVNKDKRGIKFIFLIIFLASISIFLATGQQLMFGYEIHVTRQSSLLNKNNKIYADTFFETNMFDNSVLQELVDRMVKVTSNSNDYENESIEDARNMLNELKDIKFFVKNNSTGKIYTNTNYESNEDFRKNQKDYCNLEIDLNNSKSTYSKIIDNKRMSSKIDKDYFWSTQGKSEPISISISTPKEINNYDSFEIKQFQYDFKYYRNYIDTLFKVLISSGVISIISLIACIKIKGKLINKDGILLKIYRKIPIEIYIVGISILLFSLILDFGYIVSIIAKFIAITLLTIWIIYFKNLDKKKYLITNSITYNVCRFFINIIKNIIKYKNKLPLVKRLILVELIIVIIAGLIFMFLYTTEYWYNPVFMLIAISGYITLSLAIITGIILNKVDYLDKIIKGTKEIKNGNINHKIEVKGKDTLAIFAQDINNLSEGLENAIDEKFRSERMKAELITNVSHDLKTPLTSIINYVDLIKKEENIEPEYLKDYINVLDNKSKRLKVLIEDLFEASKASSGNIELNIEKLDLNQLLRQSIGENEEKISKANLDLKVNLPKEQIYINCDGKRMYRVFENLLINISKYSLHNTRVYIDMKLEEEKAYISFKNISAYELNFEADEIIERFKRGDLARNTEGSGLGLAIARDLVELQGGDFDIQIDGDLFKVNVVFNKIDK